LLVVGTSFSLSTPEMLTCTCCNSHYCVRELHTPTKISAQQVQKLACFMLCARDNLHSATKDPRIANYDDMSWLIYLTAPASCLYV
jgi:hypothetical protein